MPANRDSSAYKSIYSSRVPQDSPAFPNVEENGLPSVPRMLDTVLTPQQCTAISHLIAGKSLSSIATLMSIDRKTLYNWRQLPAFQNALQTLCAEACETTAMRLRNLLLRGTHELAAMMEDARSFDELVRLISNKRVWDLAKVMPQMATLMLGDEPPESVQTKDVETKDTDRPAAEIRNEDRPETSGPARRQVATPMSTRSERQTTAPIASREGPAEGTSDTERPSESRSADVPTNPDQVVRELAQDDRAGQAETNGNLSHSVVRLPSTPRVRREGSQKT